jgi:hypothetical protein
MMSQLTQLVAIWLTVSTLSACSFGPRAKTQSPPPPETTPQPTAATLPAFNWSQTNSGRFILPNGDRSLKAATVSGRGEAIELTLEGTEGKLLRFSGTLVSRTPTTLIVDLLRSGDADASGTVRINYEADQITGIVGNGLLDGQDFAIEFGQDAAASSPAVATVPAPPDLSAVTTLPAQGMGDTDGNSSSRAASSQAASSPPELDEPASSSAAAIEPIPSSTLIRPDINLSQQGAGVFSLAGQGETNLSSVSVIGREDRAVDVALRFTDGEQIRFTGQVERRDPEAIVIRLTRSGEADASGTVTIKPGRANTIGAISGAGQLDSQPFSVQFGQ